MDARRLSLIFGAVAIIVASTLSVAALLLGPQGQRPSGVALIGGPFELVDQRGQPVSDGAFRGQLMLVYFGYTYCPDVCPTELLAISEAIDLLAEDGRQVQPVFITIDPARDTVEALADYAGHFHPRLVALTGTPAQIAAAAKAYRVYYAKAGDDASTDYLMDHSAFVYLMGPDGRYLSHFAPATPPQTIAERIREHL